MSAERRKRWRDAVKASGLSPGAKLAALLIADWWPKDADVVWVELPVLMSEMSVSKRTAQKAIAELRDEGWLVMVEKARQHRSPRYAPTLPRGADPAPLSPVRGADPAPLDSPRGADFVARGADFASRGADSAPETIETIETTTTKPPDVAAAAALAMVVVEEIPHDLAVTITRSVIRRRCVRLVGLGWTADLLRQSVRDRPWGGIRAGGVVAWLDGLDRPDPPASSRRAPGCPECIDGWLPDEFGQKSARRHMACRDRSEATA